MLHQRHVLVRGGVEYDIGTIAIKDLVEPRGVAHGANLHGQFEVVSVEHTQLLLDLVGIVLIDVENHKLARRAAGDLTAQLRADGAAAARDENGLIGIEPSGTRVFKVDRLAEQDILDLELADLPHVRRWFVVLHQRVAELNLAAEPGIVVIKPHQEVAVVRGDRHDDRFDLFGVDALRTLLDAVDRYSADVFSDFCYVLVDEEHRLILRIRVALQVVSQIGSDVSCADDGNGAAVPRQFILCAALVEDAVCKARRKRQQQIKRADDGKLPGLGAVAQRHGENQRGKAAAKISNDQIQIRAGGAVSPYIVVCAEDHSGGKNQRKLYSRPAEEGS